MKCNQSRPGFELVSPCSFPTTITITPRVHIYTVVCKYVYTHESHLLAVGHDDTDTSFYNVKDTNLHFIVISVISRTWISKKKEYLALTQTLQYHHSVTNWTGISFILWLCFKCITQVKSLVNHSVFAELQLHTFKNSMKFTPLLIFSMSITIIWTSYFIYACCDAKLTKIPKWDFIFARVKTGQVGTWSPTE